MVLADIHTFHFLRPHYLWLFVALIPVVAGYFWKGRQQNKWVGIIAGPLRKYVIEKPSQHRQILPLVVFVLAASLFIFSLAGPTYKKKKLPTVINEAEAWIALDVSQSMMTQDITPSRLERAKLKIRDLLNAKTATRMGLIVYSGTPHIVFPPSVDARVFVSYMEVISPAIMPVQGENYLLLSALADSAFSKMKVPGTLILLTDHIDEQMATALKKFRDGGDDFIKLWLISTEKGGVVPGFRKNTRLMYNGKAVTSALSKKSEQLLQNQERIELVPITMDNSDVQHFAAFIKAHKEVKQQVKDKQNEWEDDGIWLLWLILPLMLLWFRKGWVLKGFGVMGAFLVLTSCGTNQSNTLKDAFETKDYQAQQLEKQGKYKQAANLYTSIPHKAYAWMQAGDYEAAANLYALDSSAHAQYNAGLLFQQIGDYTSAKNAFQKALKKDPGFTQASTAMDTLKVLQARREKDIVKRKYDTSDDWKQADKKKSKQKQWGAKDRVDRVFDPHGKDNSTTHMETQQTAKQFRTGKKFDKKYKMFHNGDPISVLIRSSQSNPGTFLKKKFEIQKKNYYPDIKETDKLW